MWEGWPLRSLDTSAGWGDERAMNCFARLATAAGAALLLASCVTEPAPDEPKVYGSVTTPKTKKTKQAKPSKRDDTVYEVERATPPTQ